MEKNSLDPEPSLLVAFNEAHEIIDIHIPPTKWAVLV
jgi:hypothetical protein